MSLILRYQSLDNKSGLSASQLMTTTFSDGASQLLNVPVSYPEFPPQIDTIFPGAPTTIFRRFTMAYNAGVTDA